MFHSLWGWKVNCGKRMTTSDMTAPTVSAFWAWIPGLNHFPFSERVKPYARTNQKESITRLKHMLWVIITACFAFSVRCSTSEAAVFVVEERHSGSELWFIWVMDSSWPSISVQSLCTTESHFPFVLLSVSALSPRASPVWPLCHSVSRNNLHACNAWDMHCFFVLAISIL